MCVRSDSTVVPLLILVLEADGEAGGAEVGLGCPSEALAALPKVLGELRGVAQAGEVIGGIEVLAIEYGAGCGPGAGEPVDLCSSRIGLKDGAGDMTGGAFSGLQKARYPSLEEALFALGGWVLRHPEMNAPVFVLHVTSGRFKCCAEVERAAGTVKTACDVRGAPGVFYNLWLTETGGGSFPGCETSVGDAAGTAKTLFRMASPVGAWGAEILAGLGQVVPGTARYLEAVPSVAMSLAHRFAGSFVAGGVKQAMLAASSGVDACAFLMPKEGDALDKCEDVVSVHRTRRRFAVSDGATTASYSAEWARALCRHAVECPPPVLPEREGPPSEEEEKEGGERLRGWLEPVLEYWKPEVPWERLVRPSMYNKAKEGAGATLAGIELLEEVSEAGVKFRAWALGDSCIIQIRGNQVVSARPMADSAKFSHVPRLLMTQPGYEEKYARFWQSWEATMAPGDTVLLGTDALCEYVLKTFEGGSGEEVIAWLGDLSGGSRPEAWRRFEEFVGVKRKQGELKNDDVGLILMRVRGNGS